MFSANVLLHLGAAIADRPIFRATTLGTALHYAETGIDLLRPVIIGFNATGTPTILEFPLWQAAVALVFKVLGSTWYGWGNVVSLLLFSSILWPLLQLFRAYSDERTAQWSLAFFLAQPLIILFGGQGSADSLSLVLSIWFLFCAWKLITSRSIWWWIPAAAFGALSAITKLPFFMTAGLCAMGMVWLHDRRSFRSWSLLAGTGIVSALVFAAWTHHGNSMAAQAELPYAELRLSESSFMRQWYFGDLNYRLSPQHWAKAGWRFLHATVGALPMAILLLVPFLQRGFRMPKLWLAACFATTLVFTHLVLEHWHYYLMFCPAVALLCGSTICRFESGLASRVPTQWIRIGFGALVLVFSTIGGLMAMKLGMYMDPFPAEVAKAINANTASTDKLIVYQRDPNWGGEVLFRSNRNGLSVLDLQGSEHGPAKKGLIDMLNEAEDLARLKSLGYNKVALISESPVWYGTRASNPLRNAGARLSYPEGISAAVDDWPVVFQSPDVLIKAIP